MVEKFEGVGCYVADPSALESRRGAIAGSIRNDHADTESIVGVFVGMSRFPGSGHSLKSQEWPTIRRTVFLPCECATVAERQPTFPHHRIMRLRLTRRIAYELSGALQPSTKRPRPRECPTQRSENVVQSRSAFARA